MTAWGLKNMVEFNASKTQYCTLSTRRPNQEVPKRALGSNEQPGSPKKSLIQAFRTAGKKLEYLFRARKYFSPSNLLTLYKAQIRPSLEYCSHIWGAAAPTTLLPPLLPCYRFLTGVLLVTYHFSTVIQTDSASPN
nr:unnamed protein product [Callosobruchus chinensis]